MQRLALAVIVLALVLTLFSGVREAVRAGMQPGGTLRTLGDRSLQKLAFAALFLVIFGVSAGWLGGL